MKRGIKNTAAKIYCQCMINPLMQCYILYSHSCVCSAIIELWIVVCVCVVVVFFEPPDCLIVYILGSLKESFDLNGHHH